ncbi:hypothetical protein CPC08DRAFT_770808 [Agrocybe pediades]|nr:hypothetical protein CPC08DRAFT_770808 [Agrocybe pediades]
MHGRDLKEPNKKPRRQSAVAGELKTQSHFFTGGMLDSQTDSQAWVNAGCQVTSTAVVRDGTTSLEPAAPAQKDVKAEIDTDSEEPQPQNFSVMRSKPPRIYTIARCRTCMLWNSRLPTSEIFAKVVIARITSAPSVTSKMNSTTCNSLTKIPRRHCHTYTAPKMKTEASLKEEIDALHEQNNTLREELRVTKAVISGIRDSLSGDV